MLGVKQLEISDIYNFFNCYFSENLLWYIKIPEYSYNTPKIEFMFNICITNEHPKAKTHKISYARVS